MLDTKEIRNRIQQNETKLSYERPWPLSYQEAHDVIYELLDTIERLQEHIFQFHKLHPHQDDYVASATDKMIRAQAECDYLAKENANLKSRVEAAEAKVAEARGLADCLIAETNVPVWSRILQTYLPGLRALSGKENE